MAPPQPPPHNAGDGRYWGHETGYAPNAPLSNITPGADNFGETAQGGMAALAYTVAEQTPRQSGLDAARGVGGGSQPPSRRPSGPHQQPMAYGQPNLPQQAYRSPQYGPPDQEYGHQPVRGRRDLSPAHGAAAYSIDRDSHSSLSGLALGAVPAGEASAGMRTPSRSPHSFGNDIYTDDPYAGYSTGPPALGVVNPNEIEDDGDDGLGYGRRGPRTSMLSLGGGSRHSGRDGAAAAAAGGPLAGFYGRDAGKQYDPVHNGSTAYPGNGSSYDLVNSEKLAAAKKRKRNQRWKLAILFIIGFLILAGIALGVVFGIVLKNRGSGANPNEGSGGSASSDTAANGDLDINSPQIQALMNNANLHKVFPGIDYTPINTQFPDCLTDPPSQNNVTRDVAVLSQLTNTIRLYGTDCNQTEMTIHAINQLKLADTVKIWMGVWQDNNDTTNARQLAQMYDILTQYGSKNFVGVIVANEILFRQQMTVTELSTLLEAVRANFTKLGIDLPVATSDLGDNWTAQLAQASDYVMSNIHPFFAGTPASQAASWTNSFWQTHDGPVFKSDASHNIIAETGWPSQGGTDCGSDTVTSCPDGSVAGIDEMNQFMSDWVCSSLANGTQYFWFESFDEPWKISFDTPGKEWEDHWGLMDVDRNLKSGVKIPDCGGKTV
jgi:exo-beta-1,3-glucanase (GH17 family)